jgi:hypothetical protein
MPSQFDHVKIKGTKERFMECYHPLWKLSWKLAWKESRELTKLYHKTKTNMLKANPCHNIPPTRI